MPVDARQLATDLLGAAHQVSGNLTVRIDIGNWRDELVRETFDHILADCETYKLRLRGIRTDTAGFSKFGVARETANSGRYNGVPIVMTPTAPFDTMELVFGPNRV
jgi:hypothetical protein